MVKKTRILEGFYSIKAENKIVESYVSQKLNQKNMTGKSNSKKLMNCVRKLKREFREGYSGVCSDVKDQITPLGKKPKVESSSANREAEDKYVIVIDSSSSSAGSEYAAQGQNDGEQEEPQGGNLLALRGAEGRPGEGNTFDQNAPRLVAANH